ncbi:MAG TPA: DUF1269 domain-containing protein [Nitrososphaerales archaeon]|nr:DUF1269 domain-containing protein [Nitrososphaerales archaeon]
MTDMVVLAFDGVDTGSNVKNRLIELNNQFLLKLDQVVEVVRKPDGEIKIKEEPRLTGVGAVSGAFWGLLMGLIFLVPVAGFIIGSVSGAVAGHFAKYGISKEYMKEIDAAIQPGQSALFLLVDNVKADRVIPMLTEFHPKVLRTSLSADQEAKLKEAFGGSTMTAPTMTA